MRSSQKTQKKFTPSKALFFKALGVSLLAIVGLAIVISTGAVIRDMTLGSSGGFRTESNDSIAYHQAAPGAPYGAYETGGSGESKLATSMPPSEPRDEYVSGSDAEEFEITEYIARIRTSRLDRVCSEIEGLKPRDGVIFQNAERGDDECSYVFKVEEKYADAVRAEIEALSPRTFQEKTETILPALEDFISEEEILRRRLEFTEETLGTAQEAYEEIAAVATQERDVETLSRIIERQMQLIERLTRERTNIMRDMDRLEKRQTELLDRMDYIVFNVRVDRYVILDGKALKDSWMSEMRQFVYSFNRILQETTTGLALYLLRIIQFGIYLLIALIVAKYGWRAGKEFWKKK